MITLFGVYLPNSLCVEGWRNIIYCVDVCVIKRQILGASTLTQDVWSACLFLFCSQLVLLFDASSVLDAEQEGFSFAFIIGQRKCFRVKWTSSTRQDREKHLDSSPSTTNCLKCIHLRGSVEHTKFIASSTVWLIATCQEGSQRSWQPSRLRKFAIRTEKPVSSSNVNQKKNSFGALFCVLATWHILRPFRNEGVGKRPKRNFTKKKELFEASVGAGKFPNFTLPYHQLPADKLFT